MRTKKIKVSASCPFCGRVVDKNDADADFMIRNNKYLREKEQYYHKTCYQKFYSVRSSKNDRTTTSTESN